VQATARNNLDTKSRETVYPGHSHLQKEPPLNTLFRVTLFLVCITAINLASSIGTPANADVVTDWNNAALDAIRAGNTAPPIASRSLAILHASIYDAVNGIARTQERYLVPSVAPTSASRPAAASAAAHRTLVNLFPASRSSFDALHAAILAGIPDGSHKRVGIIWGEFVVTVILAVRANDGSNAVVPPPGGSGPGVWVPTPPAFLPYLLPRHRNDFSKTTAQTTPKQQEEITS
jgi:hypothetical protein